MLKHCRDLEIQNYAQISKVNKKYNNMHKFFCVVLLFLSVICKYRLKLKCLRSSSFLKDDHLSDLRKTKRQKAPLDFPMILNPSHELCKTH